MVQTRSVLSVNKELSDFCSIFQYEPNPNLLLDSEGMVQFQNHKFDQQFGENISSAEEMEYHIPGFERCIIAFLENNNLIETKALQNYQLKLRRIVNVEHEFVMVTLLNEKSTVQLDIESKSNAGDKRPEYLSLLKLLVDNAPEAILLLDFENKVYIEANPKALKLFGYSKKQLSQTHLGELSPEYLSDGRNAKLVSQEKIKECIKTGKSVKFDWEIKRIDGKLIPCEINVLKLPTTRGIYIRSSIVDLSYKKKAQIEIKAQKEQFKKLFGSDIFAMVMFDKNGSIKVVNNAFGKFIGKNHKDLKNTIIDELLVPQDCTRHKEYYQGILAGKKLKGGQLIHFYHHDGHEVIGLVDCKKYTDWKGEVFLIETLKDLTLEKQTTQALKESEIRFRSLFQKSIVGIALLNIKTQKVISINPMGQMILGFTEEELQASPEKVFGESRQKLLAFKAQLKRIIAGHKSMLNTTLFRKDGTIINLKGGGYHLNAKSDGVVVLGFTDTTEAENRKRQYIKQSNQIKAFIEYNMIPVAMFDKNMNYLLVGNKWLEMYPTKFGSDIIGKNYYDIHPNIPQRWKLFQMKAMAGETIRNTRDSHILSSGKEEWFKWLVKPWYESDNEVGGIIIYAEIITDEVNANQLARNQEARYKRFFENSTLGWIETNSSNLINYCQNTSDENFSEHTALQLFREGFVVNLNDQIVDIFGLKNKDPKNFVPTNYIISGMKTFARQMITSLRDNVRIFEDEITIRTTYNQIKCLFVSVRLPEDDDYTNIIYSVLDITDLRSSISALRESEERYRSIFESNSYGVVYSNFKKSIIRVNPAFTRMFGYTEEEIQQIPESKLLFPKFKKANIELYEKFKNGEIRQAKSEKDYRRKNGKKLIANTASTALYDGEGNHYGVVTIIEDITDRKLTERRIQKQNDELRKINQELDQFVYSAAHDLRAPIANVLGLVKLLKLEDLGPVAEQYVGLQEKSLDKLDEFIKSIVDYSRNSRMELAQDELDFKSFIQEIVNQYSYFDNAQKLNVTIDIHQSKQFITDSNRLSIVMNNLISNAVRYMDIDKPNPYLKVIVKCTNTHAKITVEDNGIGIEEKHLSAIFDLFYRANSDSKGTGIGLYIVKEAVAKLKGTIGVRSKFGKGSKFTVQIKNLSVISTKKK